MGTASGALAAVSDLKLARERRPGRSQHRPTKCFRKCRLRPCRGHRVAPRSQGVGRFPGWDCALHQGGWAPFHRKLGPTFHRILPEKSRRRPDPLYSLSKQAPAECPGKCCGPEKWVDGHRQLAWWATVLGKTGPAVRSGASGIAGSDGRWDVPIKFFRKRQVGRRFRERRVARRAGRLARKRCRRRLLLPDPRALKTERQNALSQARWRRLASRICPQPRGRAFPFHNLCTPLVWKFLVSFLNNSAFSNVHEKFANGTTLTRE